MIPLHTPPGAEIVCLKNITNPRTHAAVRKGNVYTLSAWVEAQAHDDPSLLAPCVTLAGIDEGQSAWLPDTFRLLEIHPSLTALLKSDPIDTLRFLEREHDRV